jgi:hypothetical protein
LGEKAAGPAKAVENRLFLFLKIFLIKEVFLYAG